MDIPRHVVAEILEREIAKRNYLQENGEWGGGTEQLAHELAASGEFTHGAAARSIYRIRTGNRPIADLRRAPRALKRLLVDTLGDHWQFAIDVAPLDVLYGIACDLDLRPPPQQMVSYDLVDRLVQALGAPHLWRTDLAEHDPYADVPPPPPTDEEYDSTCAGCGTHIDWQTDGVRVELVHEKGSGRWRRDRWWSLCNACAAGLPQGEPVGRGRLGRGSRLTERKVMAAYTLYTKAGLSFNALGKLLYQQLGYATPNTCAVSLGKAFQRLGLPARDRIEATVKASRTRGVSPRDYQERRRLRLEAGLTLRGHERQPACKGRKWGSDRPCGRSALKGSDYCYSHDPDRAQARLVHLRRVHNRNRKPATVV